jgi:hypothetical protein
MLAVFEFTDLFFHLLSKKGIDYNVIKSRRRWARHVEHTKEKINT